MDNLSTKEKLEQQRRDLRAKKKKAAAGSSAASPAAPSAQAQTPPQQPPAPTPPVPGNQPPAPPQPPQTPPQQPPAPRARRRVPGIVDNLEGVVPDRVLTPEEARLEKLLVEARQKYAEAYKEFLENRNKEANIFKRGLRLFAGSKVPDKEVPPELKALEASYDAAAAKYGEEMFNVKRAELENNSALSPEDRAKELNRYKQNEIFTTVIIKEQSMLTALKAENLPPKEKNILKKSLDWYLQQSQPAKFAISVIGGTLFFGAFASGTVAAAGGLAAFAGIRTVRGLAGMIGGKAAGFAIDLIWKDRTAEQRRAAEEKLGEIFKEETFDTSIAKSKKEYAEILERERKAKRDRLITKTMVGIAAGFGASALAGGMLHTSADQLHPSGSDEMPEAPPSQKDSMFRLKQEYDAVKTSADAKAASLLGNETETIDPATGLPKTTELGPLNPDAIVGEGKGIEHAFIKQIQNNQALAKELGWDGKQDLQKFAGWKAHRLALDHGYVNEATGEEVWVKGGGGNVAYEVKVVNGETRVYERLSDGTLKEMRTPWGKFEATHDKLEDYEYKHSRYRPAAPKSSDVAAAASETTSELNQEIGEYLDSAIKPSVSESLSAETGASSPAVDEGAWRSRPWDKSAGDEGYRATKDFTPEELAAYDESVRQARYDESVRQARRAVDRSWPPESAPKETGAPEKYVARVRGYQPPEPDHYRYPEPRARVRGYGLGQFFGDHDQAIGMRRTIGYDSARGGYQYAWGDLSDVQSARLNSYPEFAHNPQFSGKEIWQAYEASRQDLKWLFGGEHGGEHSVAWNRFDEMKAGDILKHVDSGLNTDDDRMAKYLHLLKDFSDLKPKGGVFHFEEKTEQFVARALLKLTHENKLGNFQAAFDATFAK